MENTVLAILLCGLAVWIAWNTYRLVSRYRKIELFKTPIRGNVQYKCRFASGRAFVTGHWARNSVKVIVTDQEIWITLSGLNALVASSYQLMHRFDRSQILSVTSKKHAYRSSVNIVFANHIGAPVEIEILPWNAKKLLSALDHDSNAQHNQEINQGQG